jgi:UDP-glucose 4-epimerase
MVTGGAGFIGSSLVDRLLERGHHVIVCDNLSTGKEEFLKKAKTSNKFEFAKVDLLDAQVFAKHMKGVDFVYHLAANADVRFGTDHPTRDLEQNTIATTNVLEAMREHGVKKIAFSSTGSVYGEAEIIPTPEAAPYPVQTSLYAASKQAAEGFIQAYCEGFGFQGWIFRFVSILGERYTHGHVFDFYEKLRKDSKKLHVLGNGKQRKSYLYIQDCLDAIECAVECGKEKVNIFNLGTDEYIEVNDSIKWISGHLNLNPQISYEGGERGWIGDNPFIYLDCKKIRNLGWQPKTSIKEGVLKTLQYLEENTHLLERGVR